MATQQEEKLSKELCRKMLMAKYGNGKKIQKEEFPSLQKIAQKKVAENYQLYPKLDNIPESVREGIIKNIKCDYDVKLTAPNILQEDYWKRCCEFKWKKLASINLGLHGYSWKIAFLERFIVEFLQDLDIQDVEERNEKIKEYLMISAPWVHSLNITQMKYSLDIELLSTYLPSLSELTLTYGLKNVGMNYTRQTMGMKLQEADNLGRAIQNCSNLLVLKLPANAIDDDWLKYIIAGINMNISLIEIDLSHNQISTEGARRIAKYLMRNDILIDLNLSNNNIQLDGSRFIAQALKINKNLQILDISLNNISDKGGMKFFQDLQINKTLEHLSISGNQFSFLSAQKLQDFLEQKCNLKSLSIGNNDFTENSFALIKAALMKNRSLSQFDISGCNFNKDTEENDMGQKKQLEISQQEQQLHGIVIKSRLQNKDIYYITQEELQLMNNAKKKDREEKEQQQKENQKV